MSTTIDLRSDTVTWPTAVMRQAMAAAPVGDDVYGDDPTVKQLENLAANILGKEAALFAVSGTMGNQLALMSLVERGNEVILSDRSHIVIHEAGAAAILSGAQLRCLPVVDGQMSLPQLEETIRKHPEDIHSPRTDLICLENADSDGLVLPIDYQQAVSTIARQYHIPVHLDGARLFNAAAACPQSIAELAVCADTVQICLSKGLCAPFGSLLAGTAQFIAKARRKRKILGGGMRQAGIMAAAGLIALKEQYIHLTDDHRAAQWLADALSRYPQWFEVLRRPQINLLFFRLTGYPIPADQLPAQLASHKILITAADHGVFRFVTHHWISQDDLKRTLDVLIGLATS